MEKKFNQKSIVSKKCEDLMDEYQDIKTKNKTAIKNYKKIKVSFLITYIIIAIYFIIIYKTSILDKDILTAAVSFGVDLIVIVLSISKKTKDQFEKTMNVNNNILSKIKKELFDYMYNYHLSNEINDFCSIMSGNTSEHSSGYNKEELVNIYVRSRFLEYSKLLKEETDINNVKKIKNNIRSVIAGLLVLIYFIVTVVLYCINRNIIVFVMMIGNGSALFGFIADDIVDVGNSFLDKKYEIKDKQSNLREEILNDLQKLYLQGQLIDKHIICFEKLLKNDKTFNFDENSSI